MKKKLPPDVVEVDEVFVELVEFVEFVEFVVVAVHWQPAFAEQSA